MASFPGVYRAKASTREGANLVVFIPQVFGEAPVTIKDFVGAAPTSGGMGWVAFQGGNPEFPVWFGVGAGVGTDLTAVETEIEALQAADVALDTRLDDAEADITTLQAADTAFDTRIDTTESDITALEAVDTATDTRLDALEALYIPTTTWSSPFFSGVTLGSGTLTANYTQFGDFVHCNIAFVLGSGSSITGDIIVTVPVTAISSNAIGGTGRLVDAGVASYAAIVSGASTTTANIRAFNTAGTFATTTPCAGSTPHAWGTGDSVVAVLNYMAA